MISLKKEIKYLGHVVSEEGVSTDPDKIKSVTEWPQPTPVTEVRSFLGFVSYYRRFIPNFSKIAKPLHKLLQNLEGTQSKEEVQGPLGPDQQEAFETLQRLCTESQSLLMQILKPHSFSTQMPVEMGLVLFCIMFRRGKRES